MLKVLFTAAESAPFYKTGGLGDVTYALPKAIKKQGIDIRVAIPFYEKKFPAKYLPKVKNLTHFTIETGGRPVYVGLKTIKLGDVTYYLIDNRQFFDRDGLYGYWDDGGRFGFFQMAVIEMLQVIEWIPDIIHANDWHTAFIPVLLKEKYGWIHPYQQIKTQLTIHNLQFQGWFPPSILDTVFQIGRQSFNDDGFAQDGSVNWLKGGINFADLVSTVSPSYAQEIQSPAFGEHLDGTLRKQSGKLVGILNGIDNEVYDPETDPHLPYHYNAKNLKGKAKDKRILQDEMHLPKRSDPLFAMVSRLTRQKGADLLVDALENFLVQNNVQVVILGTGDRDLEEDLLSLQDRFPGQLAVRIDFDEAMAQRIYAGADFFMMPSAFEPSGLAQMMAMRYGTLPIVHETGGLRDSVTPYNAETGAGTGFSFWEYNAGVFAKILRMAKNVYADQPKVYARLQQQAMAMDFDWHHSAAEYLKGYDRILGKA
ncbi:starch synthase [Lacticaseibacillus chiayiensis]|uniref:Glycogen synthase n=1 Tax=Lacticaseibacillus chiayiensis TaxID=2100821 RepID=A0A4Q1TLX1_9LACO|nr:glycogen synthase GlgA [Lacticaseibacillus chiayiensis]RXT18858.1 starch synthase [Lacticaseibacillus chiayiensis]UYN55696.1 glycogen synthase GlgA [Lacticaseibacillus chiayiensis]